ncbi:hypothetical protein ACHAXA_007979 [Cyclostephanos tholiformis]|uniref:Protein kinase domain-containing protein n=1 Tax=Cyclostephanos tholiformis TaxID=382380 RepID=A0ABD3R7N6_9STRA
MSYLTHGGYREIFVMTSRGGGGGERVILKTNKVKRKGWSAYLLDKHRRDILVSERAGASPYVEDLPSGVCPVYQYCAYTSISPFSDLGPLDKYVEGRRLGRTEEAATSTYMSSGMASTNAMGATEVYVLAMQAARGLYQAHLGSTYRSPEEYMDCADQLDTIDVYALGGVFYYLLSGGRRPWYYVEDYDLAIERILGGEKSALPDDILDEEKLDEGAITGVEEFEVNAPSRRERSRHPALVALREVMMKCWEFKPEDRPSSLQVVQMLEEKWNDVIAPTISSGGGRTR